MDNGKVLSKSNVMVNDFKPISWTDLLLNTWFRFLGETSINKVVSTDFVGDSKKRYICPKGQICDDKKDKPIMKMKPDEVNIDGNIVFKNKGRDSEISTS